MSKKHQTKVAAEEVANAYESLRLMTAERLKTKRNEPGGEGLLSLVERAAHPAREIMEMVVEVACGKPYHQSLAEHDLNHLQVRAMMGKDKALAMCFETAKLVRDDADAERCRAAFGKLLEGDSPNVKAVLAGLERLCGGRWSHTDGASGARGGAQIVYNIQLLHAPRASECVKSARAKPSDEIIEVKCPEIAQKADEDGE